MAIRSSPCWAPVVTKTSSCLAGVPSAPMTSTMTSFMASRPAVGPYCRAWAASEAMFSRDLPERLLPKGPGVGEAAGERDDAWPRERGHQVAGRGGLHALDPGCVEEVESVEVYERQSLTPIGGGLNVSPTEPPREHLPELRRHLETAGVKTHGRDCIIRIAPRTIRRGLDLCESRTSAGQQVSTSAPC